MPVSYIFHKGRKILYIDFNTVKDKTQILEELDVMKEYYLESPSEIYLMIDTTDAYTDPEVMKKLKDYGNKYFKGKSKKRAVLGVKGIRAIFMKAYTMATNIELRAFETIEEAKDYLAKD